MLARDVSDYVHKGIIFFIILPVPRSYSHHQRVLIHDLGGSEIRAQSKYCQKERLRNFCKDKQEQYGPPENMLKSMIKAIKSAVAASHQARGAVTSTTSGGFELLPSELFQQIVEQLEDASLACLALTCKRLHTAIDSPKVMRKLMLIYDIKTPVVYSLHDQRRSFLELYIRDHPQYYLCHRCYKLHERTRVSPPGPLYHKTPELRCLRQLVYRSSSPMENQLQVSMGLDLCRSAYALGFVHVQLAMAEHRCKGSGLRLESFEMTELVHRSKQSNRIVSRMLASYDALIMDDELYMRIQQWYCVPNLFQNPRAVRAPTIHFCAHYSMELGIHSWREKLQDVLTGDSTSELLSCSVCGVEYILQFRSMENNTGIALVVTKWLNLGDGLSPHARTWRQHVENKPSGSVATIVKDPASSNMTRYEKNCKMALLGLTAGNEETVRAQVVPPSMTLLGDFALPHFPSYTEVSTWVQQHRTRRSLFSGRLFS